MSSFQKIGQTGMASLAVVAPGIAEALIATRWDWPPRSGVDRLQSVRHAHS